MNNFRPTTWVKMCGLRRRVEVEKAVELGVDAIGLVFYPPSSRAITPQQVDDVIGAKLNDTKVVGLFVNPTWEEVEEVLSSGKVDYLQFHGDEAPEFCRSFSKPYLKAVGVPEGAGTEGLNAIFSRYAGAEFILLDAYAPTQHGGTGHSFDWSKAAQLPSECKARLLLAGGLTADNVGAAINTVEPFGVDVSSGIERVKGEKDLELMHRFYKGVLSA